MEYEYLIIDYHLVTICSYVLTSKKCQHKYEIFNLWSI